MLGEYETNRTEFPRFEAFMPKVIAFFNQKAEKLPGASLDQSAIKPAAANPQYRLGFMLCISGAGSLIRGGGRQKCQLAKPLQPRKRKHVKLTAV